jgi:hypothetical protein
LYVTGQNDHCLLILRVASKRIRALAQPSPDGSRTISLPGECED